MHMISSDSKLRWLQQVLLVVSVDKAMPEHLKVSLWMRPQHSRGLKVPLKRL